MCTNCKTNYKYYHDNINENSVKELTDSQSITYPLTNCINTTTI